MTFRAAAMAATSQGNASTSMSVPKVAIIGAGAAGLVTARVFSRNGIQPLVLEKDSVLGGVWQYYSPDRQSKDSDKKVKKDRPMYRGLRTNLPREVMAYREKQFDGQSDGKTMSFLTHDEVASYLSDYAKDFDLEKYISYDCTVRQLAICNPKKDEQSLDGGDGTHDLPKIKLEWDRKVKDSTSSTDGTKTSITETFDAVMVCNGHYAAPSIPKLPGLKNFKGRVMHSIEYDDPEEFRGQNVLCIGGRASGSDLAREISEYAEKVYLSDTSCPPHTDGRPSEVGNVSWVGRTKEISNDNTIHFDGQYIDAPKDIDVIIFCTGYDYDFPFINSNSNVPSFSATPGERRVMPLFEHLWHPTYPNLAFVGLQHSVVPFPFFELQAEAIVAQILKKTESNDMNSRSLPSLQERLSSAEADAQRGGPNEVGRVQDTHFLGSFQWDECRKYSQYAGNYDEAMERFIATNKVSYAASGCQCLVLTHSNTFKLIMCVRECV